MSHHGRCTRQFVIFLILLFPLVAKAESLFTGSFMSDRRPSEIIYLSLTQVENDVSGFMVLVKASEKGKTESLTLNLKGLADNHTVTLYAERLINDLPFSGYKENDYLQLTLPDKQGSLHTLHFLPSTHSDYTEKLTAWRTQRAETYQEQSRILKYSTEIIEQLDDIQNTKIPEQVDTAKKLLVRLQENHAVLEQKRERFKELFMHGQANQCHYLHSKISPFFHDELSGYFHNNITGVGISFRQSIEETKRRIQNGQEALTEVKIKMSELKDALLHRKYPLPKELPKLPSNGKKLMEDYLSLTETVAEEVEHINGEYNRISIRIREILQSSDSELRQKGRSCI